MRRWLRYLAAFAIVIGVGLFVFNLTGWELSGSYGTSHVPLRPPSLTDTSARGSIDAGWNFAARLAMTGASMLIAAGVLGLRR